MHPNGVSINNLMLFVQASSEGMTEYTSLASPVCSPPDAPWALVFTPCCLVFTAP
jgi:hypothetical protein